MPECHKCKFNGTGSQKCLECAGPSVNTYNKGRTHVSLDAGNRDMIEKRIFKPAECVELVLDDCCQDAIRRLIAVFEDLDDIDVSLVLAILRGSSLTTWGQKHRKTRASVSWRVKKIAEKHPELKFLRPGGF